MARSGERTIAASTRMNDVRVFACLRGRDALPDRRSPEVNSRPVRGSIAGGHRAARKFVCSYASNSSSSTPVAPANSANRW